MSRGPRSSTTTATSSRAEAKGSGTSSMASATRPSNSARPMITTAMVAGGGPGPPRATPRSATPSREREPREAGRREDPRPARRRLAGGGAHGGLGGQRGEEDAVAVAADGPDEAVLRVLADGGQAVRRGRPQARARLGQLQLPQPRSDAQRLVQQEVHGLGRDDRVGALLARGPDDDLAVAGAR